MCMYSRECGGPSLFSPSRETLLAKKVQVAAERGRRPRPRRDDYQPCAHGRPVCEPHAARRPSVLAHETRDGLSAHDSAPKRDHARRQLLDAARGVRPARVEVDVPRRTLERGAGLHVRWEDCGAQGVGRAELDGAHAGSDVVGIGLGGVVPLRAVAAAA